MRRLFWVGVGAAGAVLAARKVEQAVRRYTPAGVAEQVEQAGRRTEDAARGVLARFAEARAERERELVATLLVTPEGGDPGAALPGRRRAGAAPEEPVRPSARPTGRVDDDEPLYDF